MPNLANSIDCTGCMACYNACGHSAIEFHSDPEGFLQPVIKQEQCVNCGLCERSCPIISDSLDLGNAMPKVYAGWHNSDRKLSSSGGAFSAVARFILSQGGVVFGAVLDDCYTCKHVGISCLGQLDALRGSKYVQSYIGHSFRDIRNLLKEGRKVLFCGTPCQVAGLRKYLVRDYENLVTIDLACHGVPSNQHFQSYIEKLQNRMPKAKKMINFEFRQKDGWGKLSSIRLEDNKKRPLLGINALYMEAFNRSAFFRQCCYHCSYTKIPRVGDFSLADFWGIGRHGTPFKHDVMKGVSLILVNTEKGLQVLSEIGKDMFLEERTLEEALIENHNLRIPSEPYRQRDELIADWLNKNMSLDAIDQKYHLSDSSLRGKIQDWSIMLGIYNGIKRFYNKFKSL